MNVPLVYIGIEKQIKLKCVVADVFFRLYHPAIT